MDVDLIASEAPTIAADDADTHPCPGCGQPTPRDVVICLNCGHNFEAGVQLRVERKVLSRERPAMWHTAIGLSCIVFGLGGAALHGVRLFRALPDAESAAGAVESFAFGTLALLALLLGTAGVLIAMQIEAGIVMLRCWIWTKLALCSAALLAGGAAVVMFASFLNRMTFMQAQGWRLDDAGGGISAIGFVLMLWLWQCAWPAAMLFFLEGEQVRKDIKDWSKPLVPSTALYED